MSAGRDGLFVRYEQVRELGAGGQARVVLARDRRLDREVALKLLVSSDPELRRRFLHEARITARCRHANVIVIHEVGYENNWPYIVLEYLSGQPLAALLATACRLPYGRAIELLVPVLQALQHIHEVGVIHRDLKPDNIFMTDAGLLKLLDFGIAKLRPRWPIDRDDATTSNAEMTRAGTLIGTYQYMAPEQWRMGPVDQLSDIWACGIMLYRMICGHHPLHPLDGEQLYITAFDGPMPSMSGAAPPDVPPALAAVVDRCLRKIKEQRWQSAAALLAALLPFLPAQARDDIAARSDEPTQIVDTVPAAHVAAVVAHHERATAHQPPAIAPLPATGNRLLFVAANPRAEAGEEDALGQQMNAIRVELERTDGRDCFDLVSCMALEPLDLLRDLRKHLPAVVYFVGGAPPQGERIPGHALAGGGGLYFRDAAGRPRFVTSAAIQDTFGAVAASVKLVVLDRCYSRLQADALLAHVDCVVGTTAAASPTAARAYAMGLFGGLGEHQSIAAAHKQGCAAIRLMASPELPDEDPPELRPRAGVDPERLVLAAARPR